MNGSSPELSVVVPAFNEAARLEECVRELAAFLAAQARPWELIIVDDGSTDGTRELLDRLAAVTPGVAPLHLERNRGKGAALREGFRRARGRWIVFTDCDLSTPPGEIPAAVGHLKAGHDVVIGSRALPDSRLPVPQPLGRRAAGRAFNAAVRVLLGLPFADTQCGFKAFSARAAAHLAAVGAVDGFTFDVEWLLLARRAGWSVVEFPITWSDRAHSTVRLASHAPRMFAALLRLQRAFRDVVAYHPVRAMPWILASVAGAVTVQVLMKTGAGRLVHQTMDVEGVLEILRNPYIWLSVAFGALSALTWLIVLSRVDLSFAFPMLSLGFVFIALVSRFYFGETLAWNRILGMALVIAGVIMIGSSGRPAGGRTGR